MIKVADDVLIPASPRLRPRGIADLLDATVWVYRSHFLKMVLITALTAVPLAALDLGVRLNYILPRLLPTGSPYTSTYNPTATLIGQGVNLLLALLNSLVMYSVTVPALAWATGQGYLGHSFRPYAAYGRAVRRWPVTVAIIGLYLMVTLALLMVGLIPCMGWLVAPALWLYVTLNGLTMLAPVVMLENGGVMVSLKRAWSLTRGHLWRALGLIVALSMFGVAITLGPSMLTGILTVVLIERMALAAVINNVIQTLLLLVYLPLWSIGLTLLYYDSRIRQEALDLELLAGLEPQPELYARQITWLDRSDWKTLLILDGVALVPLVLCIGAYLALVMLSALLAFGGW